MSCPICVKKAQDIADHARYFRVKVGETRQAYYKTIMNETADTLENLSRYFTERCRCGEDPEQYEVTTRRRQNTCWPAPHDRPLAAAA